LAERPLPTLCVVCGRHVTITPADPAALCPDCMSATQQQVARPQRQWPLTTRGMAKGSAAVGYDDCEPCNGWEEM
jgi:predicted amidophosphoribosyltransferase